MATTSLDLVRSIVEAWERDDYSDVGWAHPEIEWVIADGPDPGSWSGLAAMGDAWRAYLRAWDEFRFDVDEYRELDGGRVLVLTSKRGRGKASGLDLAKLTELQTQSASLFHIRDGKVTKLVFYLDSERALTELGLAPATGSPRP